jgi:hypothetical protein
MKKLLIIFSVSISSLNLFAQPKIEVKKINSHQISIGTGDKVITNLMWIDSLEKPVLYPVNAPSNEMITRGFPLQPRPEDPKDHPHHIGLWLNYESVNGLDFWNNSYERAAVKHKYGSIKLDSILQMKSGNEGVVSYAGHWHDHQKQKLMQEKTTYVFTAKDNQYIIDRYTELTAVQQIVFKDVKDGLLGLRVRRELQIPTGDTDRLATGNYITSEGKTGDDAWGTKASWCMLYGKLKNDSVSVLIIDHPKSFGYPTYWHARGYGLFAANPLGRSVFSKGKEAANLRLQEGESVRFQYRVVISSRKERLSDAAIKQLEQEFASKNWYQ